MWDPVGHVGGSMPEGRSGGGRLRPSPASEVTQLATDAGISIATLRRAREALGIKPYHKELKGQSYWAMAAHVDAQDAQALTLMARPASWRRSYRYQT